MKPLEDYLTPTQAQLFTKLCARYRGRTSVCKDKYILVKGKAPVMLLAHLDTVHKQPVREICRTRDGNILMSPQGIGGDDRCGVYAISSVYGQAPVKPWLLFTCDEETGGVGAEAFCGKHREGRLPKGLDVLKLLVEIDRKGKNDAVYYDCDNKDFEEYITGKGFRTEWGSFSDISVVAPELGVAAVNLSSGYYNAHTLHEYINRKQLNATVKKVLEIVADSAKPDFPRYEYREARFFSRYGAGYGPGWGSYLYYGSVPLADGSELESIPREIRREYLELTDSYSMAELEGLRAEHGDKIIPDLFESEFGGSYEDLYGYYEEEMQDDEKKGDQ